jgi:hypothetical protein
MQFPVQQNFIRQSESQITRKNSGVVLFGWFGALNDLSPIFKNILQPFLGDMDKPNSAQKMAAC